VTRETDDPVDGLATEPARSGAHRLLGILVLLTFALLPLQSARPHPRVTVSDLVLLLAAAVALVVPAGPPLRTWISRRLAAGVGLMALGGLIGLLTAGQGAHSAGLLARLVGVALLAFWVVWRWNPGTGQARHALGLYVLVAAVSAGAGVLAAITEIDQLSSLQNGVGRAQGFGGNANLFGAITAVALAVAAVLCATAGSARSRWRWAVLGAVLAAGIAWSGSRSAVVGAVAGVAPLGIYLIRGRSTKALLAGVVVAAVVVGLGLAGVVRVPVVDRFLLRTDTAASERSAESNDVRMGQVTRGLEERGVHSLLTGSGLRDDNPTALHNAHLEVWLGLGLMGLVGWGLVIVTTSAPAAALVRARGAGVGVGRAPLLAASSGFIAYAVCALFVDNVWNRYIWLLVALVALLGRAQAATPLPSPAEDGTR
jgi:hypothetical protein